MKLATQLMIGVNTAVIGSMIGVFYLHTQEENRRFEELKTTMSQQIDSVISELHTEEKLAIEAVAKIEYEKQLTCLAKNVYHEASVDGEQGKRAIAWATINRVYHEDYPDTICDVVYQAERDEDGNPIRDKCQYSWYCDGKPDTIDSEVMWSRSLAIAADVLAKYGKETDPTNGSIMYHAHYVTPFWVTAYDEQVRIDSHIFYN